MKLFFNVEIVDETGRVHGRRQVEICQDAAYMGSRIVGEVRSGFLATMADVVRVMQVKEFRKQLLVDEAARAGACLADFLEDREGWHGIERKERIDEMLSFHDKMLDR